MQAPESVPLFPLPATVVFPHVRQPLHVFELRYRTMVRDALSRGRLFAMALLCPGWERDYHGSPEFHPIGCLVRIEEVEWLPNDCYDLVVSGVARIRCARVAREFPYRWVQVRALPQEPYSEDDPLVEMEKLALLESAVRLRRASPGALEPFPPVETLTYEMAVNALCMHPEIPPRDKLELLELDSVLERGRRVREWVERRSRRTTQARPVEGGEHN